MAWHTKCISLSIHCPVFSSFSVFFFLLFEMSVRWGVYVIFIFAALEGCECAWREEKRLFVRTGEFIMKLQI